MTISMTADRHAEVTERWHEPAQPAQLAQRGQSESAPPPAHHDTEISHEAIADEAYRIYAARGFEGGSELEDWLNAEASLRRRAMRHV